MKSLQPYDSLFEFLRKSNFIRIVLLTVRLHLFVTPSGMLILTNTKRYWNYEPHAWSKWHLFIMKVALLRNIAEYTIKSPYGKYSLRYYTCMQALAPLFTGRCSSNVVFASKSISFIFFSARSCGCAWQLWIINEIFFLLCFSCSTVYSPDIFPKLLLSLCRYGLRLGRIF